MHQPQISYKLLRKSSPETARMAVFQYFESSKNISETARVFGVTRLTIYDVIQKSKEGNLKDRSRAPKTIANKTSEALVRKIIRTHKRTGYGAKKLSKYLLERQKIKIPVSTIKGIMRRVT